MYGKGDLWPIAWMSGWGVVAFFGGQSPDYSDNSKHATPFPHGLTLNDSIHLD